MVKNLLIFLLLLKRVRLLFLLILPVFIPVVNVFGEGSPILLINGYGGNSTSWNPEFIRELEKEHTVITIDNEGKSIKQMSENAYDVIKEHDIKIVFGHSMGGYVAQELILAHPHSIDKLVLSSTRCGGDDAIHPTSKEVTDRWKRLASESKILKEYSNAIIKWNTSCDKLDEIKTPTLVLVGTNDEIIPMKNSIFLDKEIPDSRLIKIDGGMHNLTRQFPSEVADFVNDFIQ